MSGRPKLTIAIMQPYFVPYAGYFRLLAASDIFVLYDCVQFPRRGWVHRNCLFDANHNLKWLTMPLEKAPRGVSIRELRFRIDVETEMDAQFLRFPVLSRGAQDLYGMLDALHDFSGTPVDYIERLLACAAKALGLRWNSLRSSSLNISPGLAGQERILAIAKELGAGVYVNAPGGRMLYDNTQFDEAGIDLRFLPEYTGAFHSILERLLSEPVATLAEEIKANTRLLA